VSATHKSSPLRARLKAATQAAILDATEGVMAENGLGGASMHEIAERAGTSVGTLYNYFRNREDLVRALLAARRTELHGRLARAASATAGQPLRARLQALVAAALEHFRAHQAFLRIAVQSEPLRPLLKTDDSRAEGRPALEQIEERARELVAAGVAAGELRGQDAPDLPAVLGGIFRALVLKRLAEPEGGDLTDEADRIVRLFVDGAGARA
jgi:AcrR family transcriptional regulator